MTNARPTPSPAHHTTHTTVRLAKRLAEQLQCSRSTAEQYIEGGWVTVDGKTIEIPGARVAPQQTVVVEKEASLFDLVPVTLLLHKPPGFEAGLGLLELTTSIDQVGFLNLNQPLRLQRLEKSLAHLKDRVQTCFVGSGRAGLGQLLGLLH